jgi:L-asparagine transporter-like permease
MNKSIGKTSTGSADPSHASLARTLAPRHVSMISMGGIIGAGLFVGSSVAIRSAGPAAWISYLIAGLLIMLVMRMLAEMASSQSGLRSFTDFARAGLGGRAAFISGWLYWYFWVMVLPVEAIAGAVLLHAWIALPIWVIGLVLMSAMTAVNLMSTRSYGEFEFWFASIKVAAIVAFILLALANLVGLGRVPVSGWHNLSGFGGFLPHGWLAVVAGVTTAFFSMTGAEITTIAAVESRESGRALANLTRSVIVRILSFYVGSVLLIVTIVPWNRVVAGESPFTLALSVMRIPWASAAMNLIILTAVLSCLNSAFYVTSRVLFGLAEGGDAPQWLLKLNGRRVPGRAVLIGTAAGIFGILLSAFSAEGVFAFLVNASGALMAFVYIIIAWAEIRLRRASPEPAPIRMWCFPYLSYLTIAGMLAVLVAMALTPGLASQLYVSLAAIAIVVLAYPARVRRGRAPAKQCG